MSRDTLLRTAVLLVSLGGLVWLGGCNDDCNQPFCPECEECEECEDCPDCGEPVLTGTIEINSQIELDSWIGVTAVTGSLVIDGLEEPSAIRNLHALSDLESVESLVIRNTELTDLIGLENLHTIVRTFHISASDSLVTLHGLESLQFVERIELESCQRLAAINALSEISGTRYLRFNFLDQITSLNVFRDLSSLISMHARNCPVLTTLPASVELPMLDNVTLSHLPSLVWVNLGATIPPNFDTLRLQNLDGLQHLGGLDRFDALRLLEISSLPALIDLEGMGSLPELRDLEIVDTPSLVDLSGATALPDLRDLTLQGPSSLTDLSGLPPLPSIRTIEISDHDNLSSFIGLSSSSTINDATILRCASITNLTGLPRLGQFSDLTIESCENLESLSGSGGLTGVERMTIKACGLTGFTDLVPLSGCETVYVWQCPNLTSLAGLDYAIHLSYLSVKANHALTSLGTGSGYQSLRSVFITSNDALTSLEGFGSLPSLSALRISYCDGLQHLAGAVLPSTINWLTVSDSEQIVSLDGLQAIEGVTYEIHIRNNPSLAGLDGLAGLRTVEGLAIIGNTSLGNATVFDFVGNLDYWEWLEVGGNDP